jgi:hypothetical protein
MTFLILLKCRFTILYALQRRADEVDRMAAAPPRTGSISPNSGVSNSRFQSAPSLAHPISLTQPLQLSTGHVINVSVRGPLPNTLDNLGSVHVAIEMGGRTWKGLLMSHSLEPLTNSRGDAMEVDSSNKRAPKIAAIETLDPNSSATRSPLSNNGVRQDDAMDVAVPEDQNQPAEKPGKLKPVDLSRASNPPGENS